jgi:hypothetical protein
MKTQDDLWFGTDDLDQIETAHNSPPRSRAADAFFGCPVWWVKKVTPLVHSKGELLAAIHLWRLRVIQHNRKTVVLGNSWLSDELGIDRFVKSRMLHRLKRAGLVRVQSKPGQAPRVTFLKAK